MTVAFTIQIIMSMLIVVSLVFNGAVCLEKDDRPTAYSLFAQIGVIIVALILHPISPWISAYAFLQTFIMFFFLILKYKNQESA